MNENIAPTSQYQLEIMERVGEIGKTHKVWVLPILRALEALGGKASPKDVKAKVGELIGDAITKEQYEYVARNRIGWSRLGMRNAGLLTGERGVWELTDEGREYLAMCDEDSFDIPVDIPDGSEPVSDGVTETVAATSFSGYHQPLLEVLADGRQHKHKLMESMFPHVDPMLLPGDRRIMEAGEPVWRYRASWGLSDLKKDGAVRNPSYGIWEITDTGKEKLEREKESWSIEPYQNSVAKVAVENHEKDESEAVSPAAWTIDIWKSLEDDVSSLIFSALHQRLRPDFAATPSAERDNIPRNIILYGPPGTGKTFLAMKVAKALTGESETGPDNRIRLVQFHPSYAYEDFIQGLKPDLEKKELHYVLRKGPFIEVCGAAEADPDHFHVLVIDEINRGDPARIFGELMYALEYRGKHVDLPQGGQLCVPPNLVIVGTMNSVDRSVALVDYALRRRFGFVRVDPDANVITDVRGDSPVAQIAVSVLREFNAWITKRLDREHTLGHSFFLNPAVPLNDEKSLESIWQLDIQPLMEEYFFGEPDSMKEARQVWAEAVRAAAEESAEVVKESEDE
jgi:5-methylcytosine-specific restriction enzyme B